MLNFFAEKQKPIEKLTHFLSSIEPALVDLLKIQKVDDESILNYYNIEQYLATLQTKINEKFCSGNPVSVGIKVKEEFTKYSRAAPTLSNEDIRERGQDNLFEPSKLRDYASEFWDKKKQSR